MHTLTLILLFMPWGCAVMLGHLARRDFRAHLRRRHPRAYARLYGVHADRSRHSACDPLAWLLHLRFELSAACQAFGDAELNHLGRRLRRHMRLAVLLYVLALVATLAAAPVAPPANASPIVTPR